MTSPDFITSPRNFIHIDPEFVAIIPALSADERAQLEANLFADGCRDPLVIWDADDGPILLDGHNRYSICNAHDIPFTTISADVQDRAEARIWIIRNQLGRRNLSDFSRGRLALALKDGLAAQAHERKRGGQGGVLLGANLPEANTRQTLADSAGVSARTLDKIETVLEDAPQAIVEAAERGDISTHRAYLLTKALEHAPADVEDVVIRMGIDDPDTVALFCEGAKAGRDWWDDIRHTGYLQLGDEHEAVAATAGYAALRKAIDAKSQIHKSLSGVPAALQMSESNEWYTPSQYIEAARRVMGGIDLDPASNPTANETVKATAFYTQSDNGLAYEWEGRVWLNPPYGRDGGESNQATWSARLIEEYRAGRVTEAVLLVNAVTDRVWFAPLWDFTICFTDHRIRFYDESGEAGSPTHGNALIYFGEHKDRFVDAFKGFGPVVLEVAR